MTCSFYCYFVIFSSLNWNTKSIEPDCFCMRKNLFNNSSFTCKVWSYKFGSTVNKFELKLNDTRTNYVGNGIRRQIDVNIIKYTVQVYSIHYIKYSKFYDFSVLRVFKYN